ncbi:MAG: hypothetical protein V8R16_07595 [Bacilli bacterium]
MSKLVLYHTQKILLKRHIIMVEKLKTIMVLDFIAQKVCSLQKNGLVVIAKIMDLQISILLICLDLKIWI